MKFTDAHIHIQGVGNSNAELMFCNVSKPSEWSALEELIRKNHNIIPFFGTHPWYSDEYNGSEELYRILENYPSANIGEIGLDAVRSGENSEKIFTEQLDIAEKMKRIACIHNVRSTDSVLSELKKRDVKSILHSYGSPANMTPAFVKCDCYFSISPRLFGKPENKVSDILHSIPKDRLLTESDSSGNVTMPMQELLKKMSDVLCIDVDELSEITGQNARNLLRNG